jgi:hypothetical protein
VAARYDNISGRFNKHEFSHLPQVPDCWSFMESDFSCEKLSAAAALAAAVALKVVNPACTHSLNGHSQYELWSIQAVRPAPSATNTNHTLYR